MSCDKGFCHWRGPRLAGGMPLAIAAAAAAAMAVPATAVAGPARAQSLCGAMVATAPPQHVLIVMLENRRYNQVIGNSA
ncbi:MAG TPA: hypothetical protein VK162_19060, partial [Streptosporangiaceae bacterium]|nr:hypothetical protein [Streptosporangiaceae bacterium]